MYVRDHARVEFHKALGVDITEYDFTVFRITSEIARQVFPVEIDLDNPGFHARLESLRRITEALAAARAKGGVMGRVRRAGLSAAAAFHFGRLFLQPARRNVLPAQVRMAPAW